MSDKQQSGEGQTSWPVEEIPPSVLAISNLRCPSPPPILTNSNKAVSRQNAKQVSASSTPTPSQRETIPAGGALLKEKNELATPCPVVPNNVSQLESSVNPNHHKSPSVHAHFYIDETVKSVKMRSRSASNSGSELGTVPFIPNSTSTKIKTPELILSDKFTSIDAIDRPSPRMDRQSPIDHEQNANIDPRLPQDDGKFHVLLGVCGALSTAKIKLIIAKLIEIYGDKISIQLILTSSSEHFLSQEALHHLEQVKRVRIWRDADEWQTWKTRSDPVLHIELRRWADILIVSPLTANSLSKIALGLCDNLLTNVIRAWNTSYPILLAPAMVSYAYNAITTKRQLRLIQEEMPWIEILKPVEKVVGSYGDIGMGGMMDYNEIVNKIVLKLGGYPEEDDEDDDETKDNAVDDDDDDDGDDDDGDDDDGDDDGDDDDGDDDGDDDSTDKVD